MVIEMASPEPEPSPCRNPRLLLLALLHLVACEPGCSASITEKVCRQQLGIPEGHCSLLPRTIKLESLYKVISFGGCVYDDGRS